MPTPTPPPTSAENPSPPGSLALAPHAVPQVRHDAGDTRVPACTSTPRIWSSGMPRAAALTSRSACRVVDEVGNQVGIARVEARRSCRGPLEAATARRAHRALGTGCGRGRTVTASAASALPPQETGPAAATAASRPIPLRFQPVELAGPLPPPRISWSATPATSASASLAKVTRRPLIMAT